MLLSSSSESDRDHDRETLNRILAKSGTSPIDIPNDLDSDSESSGSDVQDWFRQIQEKFSQTTTPEVGSSHVVKPLISRGMSDSDDEEEDVAETMAAINRRFDQYQNDALNERPLFVMVEADTATDSTSGEERTNILAKDLKCTRLSDPGFTESHQAVDGSCGLPVKALMYSQFPKSAQNFVDALKKNRSCQRFIRNKLIEIEAKIEENKKLKERIKCLMDFQIACKRKAGHVLCQRKDPRVKLISMQQSSTSKTTKTSKKSPALYYGPLENSHVPNYTEVMKRFPVSYVKQPWSDREKENLAKGLKQQYQEMLLLNSMNLESDLEDSMNPDLVSAMLSNDLEVTPEKIRTILPLVNWDRLASMYLSGRSGAECESRWLNCEDSLINHSPWTVLEDKKLLFIVQERGIYNWIDIAITLGTQRTPFQCLARYQRSLNPHILNKEWAEDEDARLCASVEIFGDGNWQLVASTLEGRTGPQCSNRWRKTLNPDRRKVGRWSVDEDKHLKVAVMLFGAKNWNKIAQFAPGRTQVQCRERWLNCLDPSLKLAAWTEEEDAKLLAAIEEHGYGWSRVANCVPPRTDNQCMRRWKILLPHEVPLLRAARQMKRSVLISNFVDRESERPTIGPSDFSSPANNPLPDSSLAKIPLSECGKRRIGKKRARKETGKENQRVASCDKPKKSRKKPRETLKENVTVPDTVNRSSEIIHAEAENSCTLDGGTAQMTRKKTPRNDRTKKSAVNLLETLDKNITVNGISAEVAPRGTSLGKNSISAVTGRRLRKSRKKQKSHNQLGKSGIEIIQSLEIIPAYSTVNSAEADPPGLTSVPGGNDNINQITEGTSSDNDMQNVLLKMTSIKDKLLTKETNTTEPEVDGSADEDVPLISWLRSLSLKAKSKRLTDESSRKRAPINQKETHCDDVESIHTKNPVDKRKRSYKASKKNPTSRESNGDDDSLLSFILQNSKKRKHKCLDVEPSAQS